MPVVFASLDENFTETMKSHGFESYTMQIQDWEPRRKTYYVSPANSLCFMDGGIDFVLSRLVFPGVEKKVKAKVEEIGKITRFGRYYLPIGSSMVVEGDANRSLVVAPTMLIPQNISETQNVYYATMAILYNILGHRGENLEEVDLVFTSLGCGYGKMTVEQSSRQILEGIHDWKDYVPTKVGDGYILHEPNLLEQPKYYCNSEWFAFDITQLKEMTP